MIIHDIIAEIVIAIVWIVIDKDSDCNQSINQMENDSNVLWRPEFANLRLLPIS